MTDAVRFRSSSRLNSSAVSEFFPRLRRSAQVMLRFAALAVFAGAGLAGGCVSGPVVLKPEDQSVIDRRFIERPPGFDVKPYAKNLTAPTAICFDADGTLFIAEGGGTYDELEPHIFGYRPNAPPDRQYFDVYPIGRKIPFVPRHVTSGFEIYGPIGGMVAANGKLFVTHQDEDGNGAVTAFGYDGSHTPVVAGIPARGDYKMGDLSVDENGRLYFGVGAATNSGVVGLDNYEVGWVQKHPDFCDVPYLTVKLGGYRFTSPNPKAGLFSGADLANTGPYQPFNVANLLHIPRPADGKPTGAVYSVSQAGGDLRVEAWGVRNAGGIVCGDFHRVYLTDQGMEPRGSRPVVNDPDAVFQLVSRGSIAAWLGFPDYSRELDPIGSPKYQPPAQLLFGTGYPEISELIDQQVTRLPPPDKSNWLKGVFPSQAGASKLDIVPNAGTFKEYRGGLIVALFGDRSPFSTGGPDGLDLKRPTGYRVVRVDLVSREMTNFVYNTKLAPAASLGEAGYALERPIDVKFGPDGAMYILDYGQMEMKNGNQRATAKSGRIWKVAPSPTGSTTRK